MENTYAVRSDASETAAIFRGPPGPVQRAPTVYDAEAEKRARAALPAALSRLASVRAPVQARAGRGGVVQRALIETTHQETGQAVQYVRINVPGDGSCLFYSVIVASVAARMQDELRGERFRGRTAAQVEEAVAAATAQALNVERGALHKALFAAAPGARAVVRAWWDQNPGVADPAIRADIRALIDTYLGALGLLQNVVQNPGAQYLASERDLQPVNPSAQPQPSGMGVDGPGQHDPDARMDPDPRIALDSPVDFGQQQADSSQVDSSQARREEPGEFVRLLAAGGAGASSSLDASDSPGSGPSSLPPRGNDILDLARNEDVDDERAERREKLGEFVRLLAIGRPHASPSPDERNSTGIGPSSLPVLPRDNVIQDLAQDDDPVLDLQRLARERLVTDTSLRIDQWPVLQRVPPELEASIKEFVRGVVANKIRMTGSNRLTGKDIVAGAIPQGLVDGYRAAFTTSNLYAGEAALLALRARLPVPGLETHLFVGAMHLQGDDNPATVKVTGGQGHFEAIVGPFPGGFLARAQQPWGGGPSGADDPSGGELSDDDSSGGGYDDYGGYDAYDFGVNNDGGGFQDGGGLDEDGGSQGSSLALSGEHKGGRDHSHGIDGGYDEDDGYSGYDDEYDDADVPEVRQAVEVAPNLLGARGLYVVVDRHDAIHLSTTGRAPFRWLEPQLRGLVDGPLAGVAEAEALLREVHRVQDMPVQPDPYDSSGSWDDDDDTPMEVVSADPVRRVAELLGRLSGDGEPVPVRDGPRDAASLHFARGAGGALHVLTPGGVQLADQLQAVLNGPLGRAYTHAGAMMAQRALDAVRAAEEGLGRGPVDGGSSQVRGVVEALVALRAGLGVGTLERATRVAPMPLLDVPFPVFLPSGGEQAKYGVRSTFNPQNYQAEAVRQAAAQEAGMNGVRLDQWLIRLDLFNVKHESRRAAILGQRSGSYVAALAEEMRARNARVHDEMGNRGNLRAKKVRIGSVRKSMVGPEERANPLSMLMNQAKRENTALRGPPRFKPGTIDPDEKRRHLEELLSQRLDVGRDDEGEMQTQAVVKDLTGRADSQGRWRNARADDLEKAIEPLLGGWQGLRSTDEGLTGLAILHNPDQVAGGEREIPGDVDDLTPYIGPGIVNSALGGTWGLPEEGGDGTTTMQRLTARVQALYPEAAWPLYTTNFHLQLEVKPGSRVVPGSGGPRKPSRKRSSLTGRKSPESKKMKKPGKSAKPDLPPNQSTLDSLFAKQV